jgi:hypothetical protein
LLRRRVSGELRSKEVEIEIKGGCLRGAVRYTQAAREAWRPIERISILVACDGEKSRN